VASRPARPASRLPACHRSPRANAPKPRRARPTRRSDKPRRDRVTGRRLVRRVKNGRACRTSR
jgi:hypothetical protein